MYLLQMYEDRFAPGAGNRAVYLDQHSLVYMVRGSAVIDGTALPPEGALYAEETAAIQAGAEGATLWRWGIGRSGQPVAALQGDGIESRLRMSRQAKMFELVPTSKWLFRLDCIIGFQGTTGLHSHPGSGIRCLVDGHLRAVSGKGEDSDNSRPGDVWYEEGAYPLTSTVDPGKKATFLRGMVLPPEYAQYGDTATWIEGNQATVEGWKACAQKVVTLR